MRTILWMALGVLCSTVYVAGGYVLCVSLLSLLLHGALPPLPAWAYAVAAIATFAGSLGVTVAIDRLDQGVICGWTLLLHMSLMFFGFAALISAALVIVVIWGEYGWASPANDFFKVIILACAGLGLLCFLGWTVTRNT